jgi:hypothetical protein
MFAYESTNSNPRAFARSSRLRFGIKLNGLKNCRLTARLKELASQR